MRELQNVDLRVIAVNTPPDGTCDIIFIHGLDGDPITTWQHDPKNQPKLSFPLLLATDLPTARVWTLGYPAEKFGGKNARAMSIEDRAKSVLTNLVAEGFGVRRVIFIAHSLGGLLVKQMMRTESTDDPRWRMIRDGVLGVVFLATPHDGSNLANVANALLKFLGPSIATKDLERNSAKILDLREWYSQFSVQNAIEMAAFAETQPLFPFGIVVSEGSAWPGGTARTIPIDNVNHIQIAQPATREATVYKDVLSYIRLWLERDDDPSQVPLQRDTYESDSRELSRFLFRTRRVNLFGRDNELRELQRFLDDRKRFTWCAITGPGGSGKSRLALEFCLQLSPKWRAGFLKGWTPTQFSKWIPNRPTLIVVDYVSPRAKDIGLIIRDLEGRAKRLQSPIRLILLERQEEGSWVRDLLGVGEDRRTSTLSQYVSFPAAASVPPADPFDDVSRLQSLVVPPLSPEALWDCVLSVLNASDSFHKIGLTPSEWKEQLLPQLLKIDPSRRPLFAALFADAVSVNPNRVTWDRDALVKNVLDRAQAKFWGGVTEIELDVLTLATMSRGISYDCPELPLATHDSSVFSTERYSFASGARVSEKLSPLEPDIVGELFVLNRFRQKRLQRQDMVDRAWKTDALEMSAFLSRASNDFPGDQMLWALGKSPRDFRLWARALWLQTSAQSLLALYFVERSRQAAVVWYNELWESYAELLALASMDGVDEHELIVLSFALVEFANRLSIEKESQLAVAVYNELVARFGAAAEPAVREQVARALVNKGITLGQLERSEDAIVVYDELVARFGAAAEPALREEVARALFNKGVTLGQLERSEDAIAVYDELLARFGAAAEPALREEVARALVNKGVRLGQLERSEDAIVVYNELVARFDAAAEPAVREQVARALVNKGVTLGQLERSEDAIVVYNELVARFDAAAEPAVREQVARALVNKGITLGQLERSEDAIAVYDELLARFGAAAELAVREQVARALFNKGVRLGQLERSEDAIVVYNELVARFGAAAEPALREEVARALFNKGVTLGQLERSEDAIVVYDELVARFGAAAEPALREEVARALFNKGVTLGQLERSEDAIAVYDELLARFGAAAEPALRDIVKWTESRRTLNEASGKST